MNSLASLDRMVVAVLAALVFAAGCGGGGPSSSGPGTPVGPPSTHSAAASVTIDAKTSATGGPAAVNIMPAQQKVSVTLDGYGVTFLKLKP
jgi:hypothetical protein